VANFPVFRSSGQSYLCTFPLDRGGSLSHEKHHVLSSRLSSKMYLNNILKRRKLTPRNRPRNIFSKILRRARDEFTVKDLERSLDMQKDYRGPKRTFKTFEENRSCVDNFPHRYVTSSSELGTGLIDFLEGHEKKCT
jgi:hypothetical protein